MAEFVVRKDCHLLLVVDADNIKLAEVEANKTGIENWDILRESEAHIEEMYDTSYELV